MTGKKTAAAIFEFSAPQVCEQQQWENDLQKEAYLFTSDKLLLTNA